MLVNTPPLHVVVVAFGPPEALMDCLAALEGRYAFTVVDNSSNPEVLALTDRLGGRYIDPHTNLGFAAGVNCALADLPLPDCDVLLLNPDALVRPEVIEHLHEALYGAANLACVAPSQHGPNSERLDPVYRPFPTPVGACIDAIGFNRLRRRDFVIGSVLMQKGEALVDVGGFDERFFLSAEETDWQRRATAGGWLIKYCPEVSAVHVKGGTDPGVERRELRWLAGEERYLRKWHGATGWHLFRAASICGLLPRSVLLPGERRERAVRRARIYLRGPDRAAQRAGVLGPSNPRVPRFD